MIKSTMEVFQAFGEGLMSKTDSWKNYVADNVTFTGPIDQVSGKDAFVELNENFMPTIRGNNMKQIIESGNWIITQNEMQVAMPTGKIITLDMTEWFNITDGKIQSVKVYYNAEEFRKEMF